MSAAPSSHPSPLPPAAEEFLRRLRAGLARLPAAEREDILAEVRGHLAERSAQGRLELEAEFGAPEAYAARFLSEYALSGALAEGGSVALGRALLTGAPRRLLMLLLVAPLWALQVVGAALAVLGLLKPLFPGYIGAWRNEAGTLFAVGAYSGGPEARELLGLWAIPLFLLSGILLVWACNRALRALARGRLSSRAA